MKESYMRPLVLLLVLGAIVAGIIYFESRRPGRDADQPVIEIETDKTPEEKQAEYERAKEISTPDAFINTDPLTIQGLVDDNKIILVDFWTYSCINCQRTLPYLNAWHDRYADDGLVILGVHTPEFDFEADIENVERAVTKWEIEYPVIVDNDYSTWRAYENRYWPRKYLVDVDGFIVYDHIGEGSYEETEAVIVELINEKNTRLGLPLIEVGGDPIDAVTVDFSEIDSRETYFGYDREAYHQIDWTPEDRTACIDATCQYAPTEEALKVGSYKLTGSWYWGPESVTLMEEGGAIDIAFKASVVNVVAGADEPVVAEVWHDGKIHKEITISDEDLYELVDLEGVYREGSIQVRFPESGVEVYTLTFG